MMKKTLIRGGMIYDGSGGPPFAGDILVEGDRIAAVQPAALKPAVAGAALPPEYTKGADVIEAGGKAVTPGFIDIHRHCDIALFTQPDFGEIELAQGITTTLAGNCGMAPVPSNPRWREDVYRYIAPVMGSIPEGFTGKLPFDDYPSYTCGLEEMALPLNIGFLAASGAIKAAVKGFSKSPFTSAEMAEALGHIRSAMESGAMGLSFGIMYQPECYSSREEMVSMASAAGGILCTHIRGEGDSLAESVDEVIGIAAGAGIPLNISHFKATGIQNWGKAIFRAIERIEAARAKGQAVTADFYPYTGGSTTLLSLLPPTVMEATVAGTLAKLAALGGRDLLRRELGREHRLWDNMASSIGWDRILISSLGLPEHQGLCGKNMTEAAAELCHGDPVDLLAELLVSEEGRVGIITLSMAQEDVDEICRLPWTCLISDSLYGGGANPHPRLYGAFPKFLRECVRERKLLSMEEAVRKMTAMPAERAGLRDRGRLAPRFFADILIFDPERFRDHAAYDHPAKRSSGMDMVMINGNTVWREESLVARSGRTVVGK